MEELKEKIQKGELASFIEEIEKMKAEDIKRGTPAHLFEVNPDELTIEDALVWEKAKDESLTEEDLKVYMKPLLDKDGYAKNDLSVSRKDFLAFIRNKAMAIFLNRELKNT